MANQNMRTLVEEFDCRYSTAAPKLPVLQIRQKEYVPIDGIREILRGMEAERNTDVPSPEPENPEERVDATIAYFKNKTQKSISESRKKHYQAALEALCYWQEHEGQTCRGCMYKGKRHQKCNCCRRNQDLKDCYREDLHEQERNFGNQKTV